MVSALMSGFIYKHKIRKWAKPKLTSLTIYSKRKSSEAQAKACATSEETFSAPLRIKVPDEL